MSPKESSMPPANHVPPADKRREEIHRSQVNLVTASLRAGVKYQRPGRVAKAQVKRS
jgi:hypothetical protein